MTIASFVSGSALIGIGIGTYVHDFSYHNCLQSASLIGIGTIFLCGSILCGSSKFYENWSSIKKQIAVETAGIAAVGGAVIASFYKPSFFWSASRALLGAIAPIGLAYQGVKEIVNRNYILGAVEVGAGLLAAKETLSCI